jgi:hypothetical protein
VSKIAKKSLEYLKKNELREGKVGWVLYDEFHEYLEKEFDLTEEAVRYLQEMDRMGWIVNHTEVKPKRVYLTEKGDELLDKLSLWGWFRRNATAISSLTAIIGIITIIIHGT